MLSIRHRISKRSAIEAPSGGGGVGISSSVRKFWRQHYQSVPGMMGPNDQINYLIAMDYGGAQPLHRFILRSGEPAEVRKSQRFYYVAAIRRNKRHDIIVIQPSFKEPPAQVKNYRLTDAWLEKALSGDLKKKR